MDAGTMNNLEQYYQFNIMPINDGVDEPCRVVVHDKVAGQFCAMQDLDAGESWQGSLRDLSPNPFKLRLKIQVKRDGRWQDHVRYRPLTQERMFEDELKYLFFPRPGAKRLIVVFQAINTRQSYNYIGTLADVNAHRLYIKDDYGSDPTTRSSYYLGPNRSFEIADKVQRLIALMTKDCGLRPKDLVAAGSSKGGYAAIYHGLRAGAGDIVVGGPQIMLGDYLNVHGRGSVKPPILEYLAGDNSDDAVAWANSVLVDLLRSRSGWGSTVHFHVGKGEPHYAQHAQPFGALAAEHNIAVNWDIAAYDTHQELAKHFPIFLRNKASGLVDLAHDAGAVSRQSLQASWHASIPPYENLTGSVGQLGRAQRILDTGWTAGGYKPLRMHDPIPWDISDPELRSWSFLIHSLDLLEALLMAYSQTEEKRFLEPSLKIAVDWAMRHPRDRQDAAIMAWYDMAVGKRAYRLAYLYQAADKAGLLTDETRRILDRTLEEHRAELADDTTIRFHNNHGYYQIAGQLALGRRFAGKSAAMRALYDQGLERFGKILDLQFSAENVHREHSPDYHRMVLATLQGIIRSGLIADEALRQRALRIEEALAWFVLPSGCLVNFGDSDSGTIHCAPKSARERWDSDLMRAAATRPPHDLQLPRGMKVFRDSGYAIIRVPSGSGAEPAADSYLAQTACFNSRTHKHADDLSFVWSDGGEPLLVDAGRYGYIGKAATGSEPWLDGSWYTDPMRLFMESTRAHNTLEFDERNNPRRGVKPYGSAIVAAVEKDGSYAVETACKQFRSIRHERVLVFRPGKWLIAIDVFRDNLKHLHDVTQWFHGAPGSVVSPLDGGFQMRTEGGQELHAISLLPGAAAIDVETGVKEPRIQGWWSGKEREALPSPAFGFRQSAARHGVFASLMTLTGRPEPDDNIIRCNVSGRRVRLGWKDGDGVHRVEIHRDQGLRIVRPD